MDKKASPGKVVGIIFCILAGICTVVLLFMDGYFSGQMKTIDKFWTSVARGDLNGYRSCFSSGFLENYPEHIAEADLEEQAKVYQDMLGSEDIKTSVKFVERHKMGSNFYWVSFDLTVYNDDGYVTERTFDFLNWNGMKWVYN